LVDPTEQHSIERYIPMTTTARLTCLIGAALILLIGLFPPWLLVTPSTTLPSLSTPEHVKPMGFYSLFAPPNASTSGKPDDLVDMALSGNGKTLLEAAKGLEFSRRVRFVRIDVHCWAVEALIVFAATLLATLGFTNRSPTGHSPSN
jgi:hypothetical protein